MTTLGDRAVDLEHENAELRRRLAERDSECAEAIAREKASAEILQVINSSPGNLAPVFDAMLDKAIQLCDAASGHILTFDGELFRPVAARGLPTYVEMIQRLGARPASNSITFERLLGGESFVHVEDTTKPRPTATTQASASASS